MRQRALILTLLAFLPFSTRIALSGDGTVPEGASDELVGQMGRGLYLAAAKIMALRHGGKPHDELDAREKAALRPGFGTLVDRVRLVWGAAPLDHWGPIRVGHTVGQTFGYDIYLADPKPAAWTPDDLELVLHEVVHSQQFEDFGQSFSEFGYEYFKAWAQAGFQYSPNRLEVHARHDAHRLVDEAWKVYQRGY